MIGWIFTRNLTRRNIFSGRNLRNNVRATRSPETLRPATFPQGQLLHVSSVQGALDYCATASISALSASFITVLCVFFSRFMLTAKLYRFPARQNAV
jgi:hypothetical protein